MSEIIDIVKLYQQVGPLATVIVTAVYGLSAYNTYKLQADLQRLEARCVRRDELIMTALSGGAIKRGKVPLQTWIDLELLGNDKAA